MNSQAGSVGMVTNKDDGKEKDGVRTHQPDTEEAGD